MATPYHVVAGFLGVGKTTALLRELAAREGRERCAVVVNDFGEAAIDASLLGGAVGIVNIPGGCVCCTAPEGLPAAIEAILAKVAPDRIFIEPSGLGRPRDIVDMLMRAPVGAALERRPTVVLVDPMRLDDPLVDEQIEGADVLCASRVDLAEGGALERFRGKVASAWPRPFLVAEIAQGRVPEAAWDWPAGEGPRAREAGGDHAHEHPDSTMGFTAISRRWPPEVVFSWDRLRDLVVRTPGLVRFKGIVRTDLGWFRLDRAGDQLTPGQVAWRRDSRCDAIFRAEIGVAEAFAAAVEAAQVPGGDLLFGDDAAITLVDAEGSTFTLTRAALMALPGQVADVAAVVPGRSGSGVYLREVLALGGAGGSFVLAASDGMTTAPLPLAECGDAIVVHSAAGAPLPDGQGGPFRVLVPPGRSACGAVKGLARVRVLSPT